jgi:hypothetical protein
MSIITGKEDLMQYTKMIVIVVVPLICALGCSDLWEDDISELQERIDGLEAELGNYNENRTEIRKLKGRLLSVEVDLENIEPSYSGYDIPALQSRISDIEADLSDISVRSYDQDIARIETKIAVVEQDLESIKSADTTQDNHIPQQDTISVVDVKKKVTEKNDIYWQYSWQLILKNNANVAVDVDATVELQDSDGFVLDRDLEFGLKLPPRAQRTFTGYMLVGIDQAPQVSKIVATVEI